MEEKKNVPEQKIEPEKKKDHRYLNEISSMGLYDIWDYAVRKVLIPFAKKAVVEIINAYFYGGKTSSTSDSSIPRRESYTGYYDSKTTTSSSSALTPSTYTRSVYAYEDIVIDKLPKAEEVLNSLRSTLEIYHKVKVADLYELMDMPVTPNDYSYGWTSLEGADISVATGRSEFGYKLVLPRAVYLK